MLTALIAVGYAWLFNWMEEQNTALLAIDRRLIFLSAPLTFLTAWWLVFRFAPLAGGSGIPQLMAAVEVAAVGGPGARGHELQKKLYDIGLNLKRRE